MRMARKKRINLTLDDWAVDLLTKHAAQQGLSVSGLIQATVGLIATTTGQLPFNDSRLNNSIAIREQRIGRIASERCRPGLGKSQKAGCSDHQGKG